MLHLCVVVSVVILAVSGIGQAAESASVVIPRPQYMKAGSGRLRITKPAVYVKCKSPVLKRRALTMVKELGLSSRTSASSCGLEIRVEVASSKKAPPLQNEKGEQGYTLTARRSAGRVVVEIMGGDEAGAYYALRTLEQLIVSDGSSCSMPSVAIRDWPAIKKRGLIIGGETEWLMKILDICAGLKLNFYFGGGVRGQLGHIAPQVRLTKTFCDANYIEQAAHLGYKKQLTTQTIEQLKKYYDARFDLGYRTLSVCFDDTSVKTVQKGEDAATRHCEITNALTAHLRKRDPSVRMFMCPIPYGGRPDKKYCFASKPAGDKYFEVTQQKLHEDILMFWTGDGGIWSRTVTADGARLWGGRHIPFFWDNNPIRFANKGKPLSGRAPDLYKQISGYMANMNRRETKWRSDRKAEITLVTCAMYAWNPTAYDESTAWEQASAYVSRYENPTKDKNGK